MPDTVTHEELIAPESSRLNPGDMVDHFKVQRSIGAGGMGEVYLARDSQLGRKVALKLIHQQRVATAETIESFLFEAQATARFNHPHIVTVYAVGRYQGTPYVALEYIEGQTLRERFAMTPPGVKESLRILLGVAEALKEAHAHNVIHRDLKPENVLLGKDGRTRVVDFGLAKLLGGSATSSSEIDPGSPDEEQDTDHGTNQQGTPAYMSPEQWAGAELTPTVDIWALGVILHEAVFQRRPFNDTYIPSLIAEVTSPEPVSLPPADALDVSQDLRHLIVACLHKNPNDRPAASDIATKLEAMLHGHRISAIATESPFRGLRAFNEEHAELFFGRETETSQCVERLRDEPILPVIGPSGAGKSSFVQAGVVPRLKESQRWESIIVRPKASPFRSLASRLLGFGTHLSQANETRRLKTADLEQLSETASRDRTAAETALADSLFESPERLALELERLAALHQTKVLLVIDQAEEIYTLVPDELVRARFLDAVCGAADDASSPVRVMFTLRDDFIGKVAASSRLAQQVLSRVVVLRPPGDDALREIVTRPLRAAGYDYEDERLVGEMLAEVAHEAAPLPLLQFATSVLWEGRDQQRKQLTRAKYAAMGGVGGALADHANRVMSGLSEVETKVARDLLLRMVTAEGTRRIIARSTLLEGLPDAAQSVLDRLTESRLLSVRRGSKGSADPELDLAHESLIVRWQMLAGWLEEGREEHVFLQDAQRAAELWQHRGKLTDETWVGEELRDAERKLARCSAAPPLVSEFIARGRAREATRIRRRRIALASGFVALAAIALGAIAITVEISAKEKRAQVERAAALRQSAIASHKQRNNVVARALLRTSLENEDSPLARMLWGQVRADPLLSKVETFLPILINTASNHGDRVLAGSPEGGVYSMDMRTLTTDVLRGPQSAVFGVGLLANGGAMAVDLAGFLTTWDAAGLKVHSLRASERPLAMMAPLSDGQHVMLATAMGELKTLDLRTGSLSLLNPPGLGKVRIMSLAAHPKRPVTAVSTSAGEVVEVSGSGEVTRRYQTGGELTSTLVYSKDGALFGRTGKNLVKRWNEDGSVRVSEQSLAEDDFGLAVGGDGELLATGAENGNLSLWRFPDLQPAGALRGHSGAIISFDFTPDGSRLVSSAEDRTTRLWDVKQASIAPASAPHQADVFAVQFIDDGKRVLSAGADQLIRVWNRDTAQIEGVLEGHTGTVTVLHTSEDSRHLVSLGADGLRFWDLLKRRELGSYRASEATITTMTATPDLTRLAFSTNDGAISLMQHATRQVVRRFDLPPVEVASLAFSADGGTLLVLERGRSAVTILDVATGRLVKRLPGPERMTGIAFDAHDNAVIAATSERQVHSLPLNGGASKVIIEHHDARVGAVTVGVGGLVVSGGFDHDVRTKAALLRGMIAPVRAVSVSPDGRFIAGGAADGQVDVWDLGSGRSHWRVSLATGSDLRVTDKAPPSGLPWPGLSTTTLWTSRVSADGQTLCARHLDGRVELWRTNDSGPGPTTAAATHRDEQEVAAYEASNGGCVLLRGTRALWLGPTGPKNLCDDAIAVGEANGRAMVATSREVIWFDAAQQPERRLRIRSGVTALARSNDRLVLGFEHGDLETVEWQPPHSAPRRIENTEPARVERMVPGPHGVVAVDYDNGHLLLVHAGEGSRLWSQRLHGAPAHIRFIDDQLKVTSELGGDTTYDLSILGMPYCALLRRVWDESEVAWQDGRATLSTRPKDHRCAL